MASKPSHFDSRFPRDQTRGKTPPRAQNAPKSYYRAKNSKIVLNDAPLTDFVKPKKLSKSRIVGKTTLSDSLVIEGFLSSLNCPLALSILILYRHGEFKQLVEKDINPLDYNDKFKFRDDFAAVSFLRKSTFLKTGIDIRSVALDSFKKAEEACADTNKRMRSKLQDPLFMGSGAGYLHDIQRKIARILGDFSPALFEEFFDSGAFGPGSSTFINGHDTSAERKFREERQITATLYEVLTPEVLKAAYPLWEKWGRLNKALECVHWSKVTTVPKNAKTDRTIAIEPGLNTYFQKAIGKMIRRRLRLNGLNLDSAGDIRNPQMAKYGSKNPYLATVDFSSASDMIAKEVVRELLPPSWYNILDLTRSHRYMAADSKDVALFEKFSSMGNGFSFELESLIFYAAALVATERMNANLHDVSVFGDDVILPTTAYPLFVKITTYLGFRVNPKKSFSEGYFRESCGSYYFDGLDVKPLFFRKILRGKDCFNFLNLVRYFAHRRNGFIGCDSNFEQMYRSAVNSLPESVRIFGTIEGGDGCLHANFDEATPSRPRNGYEGWIFKSYLSLPVGIYSDSPAILIARLARRSLDNAAGNDCILRRKTRVSLKKILVPQWYNFGPWC